MNCKYENKYTVIAEYLTGDLSDKERSEFEAHFIECDDCFSRVKMLEKATRLIQVEGKNAFQPKPIFSGFIDGITEFFERIRTLYIRVFLLKKKRLAIPVTFFALTAASILFYNFDSKSLVSDIPSFSRSVEETRDVQDIDQRRANFTLSVGLSSYNESNYDSALTSFNAVQYLLKTKKPTKEVMKLQFAAQFGLGATKAALWEQQEYGYFRWIGLMARTGSTDWTLLEEAEKHLLAAQQISKSVKIRQEDETLVNQLLATIQKKSKLQ